MRSDFNDRHDREMRQRGPMGPPPNFGSARSDYGELAYGGRLNAEGSERGWWDRTSDEVSSWFGDEGAERRRRIDERRDRFEDRDRFRSNERRNRFATGHRPSYETMSRSRMSERSDWRQARAVDAMTQNVATVHPNDSVSYAARVMGECDCGAIPVVDRQGRMVGMITDRDIAIRLVGNGVETMHARVNDCMTDEVFACHVDDSLQECMRLMKHHQIRRVPIVDDSNRIVGIVSQADLAQHAAENSGRGERRAMTDVVCAVSEPTSGSYS